MRKQGLQEHLHSHDLEPDAVQRMRASDEERRTLGHRDQEKLETYAVDLGQIR